MIDVRWAATTHVGEVRAVNQDSILTGPAVFAIADGMGGHAAGEVASALTINTLSGLARPLTEESVTAAVARANDRVLAEAMPGSGREGMGTTLVGLALLDGVGAGGQLLVFNVGDSRAYRLAGGRLAQVSEDHSVVAEMVRAGLLTEDEARRHPSRNIITRVIGGAGRVQADVWHFDPRSGGRYLLCSDGLTNELSDGVIESVLRRQPEPQVAVDELLARALAAGGNDNISIVVADVVHVGPRASAIDDDTNPRLRTPSTVTGPDDRSNEVNDPFGSGMAAITQVPSVADRDALLRSQ